MATAATPGPEILDATEPQPLREPSATTATNATHKISSQILLYSFVAAVLLAIGGFVVVCVYLFLYLNHAFAAFDPDNMARFSNMDLAKLQPILLARAGLWKFILQSCGIISGVAFGFLGFGLFLLGAKVDMDASFADSQHKVQLTRMAPGSFVILIAAVLIGACSLNKVELEFTPITTETKTQTIPVGQDKGQGAGAAPANAGASEEEYHMPADLKPGASAVPANAAPKSSPNTAGKPERKK